MRTFAPLGLVVLGVIIIVLAVAKILPGAAGMGVGLCFLGLLLFGLGFIKRPEPATDAPPPLSPFEQTLGMFYEPAAVFKNLRIHPRWLVAVLLISIASVIYNFAFTARITPERIADHMVESLKNSGFTIPPEKIEESRQTQLNDMKSPVGRIARGVNTFVFITALMAFLAAINLVGVLAFGGKINFWQGMAISTHAALPIVLLQKVLSLGILYVKAPEDLHPTLGQSTLIQDNLGVLFSPAQNPVLFAAGSMIGVLSLYGMWLTATGVKNGAEKASGTAGWSIAIGVWLMTLLLFVTMAALLPSFIS